jgi:tryptophan synthase beta chain
MTTTFGAYGGRYVPETLNPALDELTAGWRRRRPTNDFRAELHALLTTYGGRPTPAYRAERFAPAKRLYLKREDLLHTGGAQAQQRTRTGGAMPKRLGKGASSRRPAPASTRRDRDGCARFGFDCVVYMGAEDMRRQKPNVERMHLLGAEVRPVEFGTKTLKEATSEAIRDWITNVETTHYLIGSCVGPAPYPGDRARPQRVIGDEAREQLLAGGRLPEAVVACVGGGSNAIGIFYGSSTTRRRLVGVEAAGARASDRAGLRCCTGARSSVLADDDGQIADAHSISAGLDYPGVGPEHAALRDSGLASYVACTDEEALAAFHRLAETEGIIPALESSHALARALDLDAELVLVCLSGRGDKDLEEVLAHTR